MSEVHIEDHSSPIKTPGQLITIVVAAFLVPIVGIVFIVHLVTGGLKIDKQSKALSEEAVAARLKPVGEIVIADKSVAAGGRTGEQIVKEVCQTCHGAGLLNAPKIGDAAGWKPRLAQGEKTLVEHAIKGIRSMPAKGGNPSLADDEVARAVVWMANQSGAKFKELAPAAAASAPVKPAASAPTAAPDGAHVYQTICFACHASGLAGAPKYADKAAWAPRIAQGLATLHEHAVKGIRTMPPKGGSMTLSDAEVAAAVDYMVSHSK